MKKRIIRVCHKYLSGNDGYDLDIQDLVHATTRTYTTYVLVFMPENEFEQYCARNKLRLKTGAYFHTTSQCFIIPFFYEKTYGDYVQDLYTPANIIGFAIFFRNLIKNVQPAIVHVHGTLLPQFLFAALLARKKSKVCVTHHGGLINQNQKNIVLQLLKRVCHELTSAASHKVLCVSEYGRTSFWFRKKIEALSPIPTISQKISPNNQTLHKILSRNTLNNEFLSSAKKPLLCVCPARICSQKNQERLVNAFEIAVHKNNLLWLVLVGRSTDKMHASKLRKVIQQSHYRNHYCWLPELPLSDIHVLLKNASCCVIPSINEGFGRSVSEAVLLGVPVIASKKTGYEESVQKQICLLVNPLSVLEIAAALLAIHNLKHPRIPKACNMETHKTYIYKIKRMYEEVLR